MQVEFSPNTAKNKAIQELVLSRLGHKNSCTGMIIAFIFNYSKMPICFLAWLACFEMEQKKTKSA